MLISTHVLHKFCINRTNTYKAIRDDGVEFCSSAILISRIKSKFQCALDINLLLIWWLINVRGKCMVLELQSFGSQQMGATSKELDACNTWKVRSIKVKL